MTRRRRWEENEYLGAGGEDSFLARYSQDAIEVESIPSRRARSGSLKWLITSLVLLLGAAAACLWLFPRQEPDATVTIASGIASPIPRHAPATLTRSSPPTRARTPAPEGVNNRVDATSAAGSLFDPALLQQQMLGLINRDRMANSRLPVAWDPVAAEAGRLHAEDMLKHNYFSHWNLDGLGPDHRYSLVGGTHAVMENVYTFEYVYEDGRGAPIEDWVAVIENAQWDLMSSPGHRTNILDPAHTHVGIGMAYDPATGRFRLAQEFNNQYAQLTPLPAQGHLGQQIWVRGRLVGDGVSNPLLNLAYEPFPARLSVEQLAQTGAYLSAAAGDDNMVETRAVGLEFSETLTLDHQQQPGLYHVRLFVDLPSGQAIVVDRAIEVR